MLGTLLTTTSLALITFAAQVAPPPGDYGRWDSVEFALEYAAQGIRSSEFRKQRAALASLELLLDVPGEASVGLTEVLATSVVVPELERFVQIGPLRLRRKARRLLERIDLRVADRNRRRRDTYRIVPRGVDEPARQFEVPALARGPVSLRFPGDAPVLILQADGCANDSVDAELTSERGFIWPSAEPSGWRSHRERSLGAGVPMFIGADLEQRQHAEPAQLLHLRLQPKGGADCIPSFSLTADTAVGVIDSSSQETHADIAEEPLRVASKEHGTVFLRPASGPGIYTIELQDLRGAPGTLGLASNDPLVVEAPDRYRTVLSEGDQIYFSGAGDHSSARITATRRAEAPELPRLGDDAITLGPGPQLFSVSFFVPHVSGHGERQYRPEHRFEVAGLHRGDVIQLDGSTPIQPDGDTEPNLVRLPGDDTMDGELLLDRNAWYVATDTTAGFRIARPSTHDRAFLRVQKAGTHPLVVATEEPAPSPLVVEESTVILAGNEQVLRVELPDDHRVAINVQTIATTGSFEVTTKGATYREVYGSPSKLHVSATRATEEGSGWVEIRVEVDGRARRNQLAVLVERDPSPALTVGQEVCICRRHRARFGDANWVPEMADWLGQTGTVDMDLGLDDSGAPVVRLAEGPWIWRASSLCRGDETSEEATCR